MNYYNQMFVDWFRNFNKNVENQNKAEEIYKLFEEFKEDSTDSLHKEIKSEVLNIVNTKDEVFLSQSNLEKIETIYFKTQDPNIKTTFTTPKEIEIKALDVYFNLLAESISLKVKYVRDDLKADLPELADSLFVVTMAKQIKINENQLERPTPTTPSSLYFLKKPSQPKISEVSIVDSNSEASINTENSKDSIRSSPSP